jgi:predicted esterase
VLHLQLVIETEDRGEEGGRFTRMALSAIKDDMVSEPFVEVVDVPIRGDDTFFAVFPESALPAAFSPTGSEVRFCLNLEGEIQSTSGFCGLITGEVLTLDLPLVESTFSAEPWQSRTDPIPSSCQSDGEEGMCQRMTPEMCPDLAEGMNVDFSSCEEARAFRLFLPEEHDPGQSYPLVFLWHGLGSDVDSIVRDSGLADWVTEGDFILAVPVSRAQAVEWDQLTVSDSKDLAFFDDMVTCTQARLGVDPLRIYTTGLSGGGLFSTYLGLMRADVLAATAPMSGGLIIDYQMPSRALPYLVTWGGEEDIAVEQDFHVFAQDLMGDLRGGGHFVGACNHGRGHEWPQDLNPAVVGFFRDHPMDVDGAPYAAALPETFPNYCSVLESE